MTTWHTPDKQDDEDKIKRATHLLEEAASIEQRQASRHQLNLWYATLFTNRELPAFRWGDPVADWELQPVDLKTENLIESVGEAFVSKAASSPLKPTLVPHGKRLETERAVRVLDNFLFGVWNQTDAEEACIQMFLDAYISGVGCVQVSFNGRGDKPTIQVETVFFDSILVDNRECAAGFTDPRTYRIRRVIPRAVIEARYPKVDFAPKSPAYRVDYRAGCAEGWVVVIEAWRLPDDSGNGGYHMVACDNRICFEEKWENPWVPLVFFHWTDHRSGFYGKGGVEQLLPYQIKQNDLNEAIDLAQDIVCRPRLLLNANSMIDVNQWDNEAGRMLLYSGIEPKPFEWHTNIVDLYNERERNWGKAFSHVGLSEQFAGADMPKQVRLDSSAGVREFHNMEDRRNLRRWSRYEKARMNVAKTLLYVLGTESGAEAYSAYYQSGGNRASAVEIPYKSVKALTDDQFSWTMAATPLEAMSPAARRELLRDWTSRGLVKEGSEEARRMESNPNLEREEELEMSSKEDIDLRVLAILESGKYENPTNLQNLTYGIRRVASNLHRLKTYEDVPPGDVRLFNHSRWILAAVAIQKGAVQPPQPQQMSPFSPTQGVAGTNASNGTPFMMQGGQPG